MERIDSIALEFSIAGCSVVRSRLAGVPCMTIAGGGATILVLIGRPDTQDARKASDRWRGQLCYCTDRSTAHAIAAALQDGEFAHC